MRPLRYSINVTLDGCCDHMAVVADEELHRFHAERLARADVLLFGRVIYEMMQEAWRRPESGTWPDSMDESSIEFAEVIDEVGDDRLKVYLYHIPPVAQVGFSLELIGRLRKEFPETVVGLKDSSGDWSNMKAILEAYPGFELFPGAELYMLDGLRAGAAGVISATANVSGKMMRALYDSWEGDGADEKQAKISALRKAIQDHPMIPMLKALVAHFRSDPVWAEMRPPFTAMPSEDAKRAVAAIVGEHDFSMEITVEV